MAESSWSIVTEVAVELLGVPGHEHGPRGRTYVAYPDAVETVHKVLQRRSEPGVLAGLVADVLKDGGEAAEALREALAEQGVDVRCGVAPETSEAP